MIRSLLYKCKSRTSGPRRKQHLMILYPTSFIQLLKASKLTLCALYKFQADKFINLLGSAAVRMHSPERSGNPSLISLASFSHLDFKALELWNFCPPPTFLSHLLVWGSFANNRGDSQLSDYSQPVVNARPCSVSPSMCLGLVNT